MSQKQKNVGIALSMLFFLILCFSLFKFFPVFQSSAEDETPEISVEDVMLNRNTVNTYDGEEGETTVRVCTYISSTVAIESASVRIDPYSHWESNAKSITAVLEPDLSDTCENLMDFVPEEPALRDFEGYFIAEVEFPVPSLPGEWSVNLLVVYLDELDEVEVEIPTFEYITNSTDTPDVTAPEVVAWAFEPDEIDTDEEDVELKLYVRFRDDISGISYLYDPQARFRSAETGDNYYYLDFTFEIMDEDGICEGLDEDFTSGLNGCGDEMDGIYVATKNLRRYSPKGTWELEYLYVRDNDNNSFDTYGDNGVEMSFLNSATTQDITPPVLNSLTMTPSHFNSNLGDQTITVTMQVQDDLSGVTSANVNIRPLIGSEGISETVELEDPLLNGEITFTITIPQGSKTGLWVVEGLGIEDRIGNSYGIWGFKQLSFTFPDLDLFLINQAMSNEVLIEEDWYIEEWDDYEPGFYLTHPLMSIKFQAGTVVTKKDGGSFAFHRMLSRKYNMGQYTDFSSFLAEANQQLNTDLQSCDSTEGCFDSKLNDNNVAGEVLNVIKMGIPGLNLSFSKPVIISLAVEDKYLGTTFVIQTFDHELGEWVNQTTCLVKTIEPSSYEHGGGPDGFFKPGPYTACQFETDHASFFSTNILGESTTKPGVPNTGLGGIFNYLTRWIR